MHELWRFLLALIEMDILCVYKKLFVRRLLCGGKIDFCVYIYENTIENFHQQAKAVLAVKQIYVSNNIFIRFKMIK